MVIGYSTKRKEKNIEKVVLVLYGMSKITLLSQRYQLTFYLLIEKKHYCYGQPKHLKKRCNLGLARRGSARTHEQLFLESD